MADLPRRVALVYDRVNKWGGAEQVLLALNEIFPDAPLYTAVYNSKSASWAKVFPEVISSFLQNIPTAKYNHEFFPWLTPMAFESLDLRNYDLVISVTSADAKGIITLPSTLHICYCLTPTRYLWSHESFYKSQLSQFNQKISAPVFDYLKTWDQIAAQRPDSYIAISKTVQDRIYKYYHRSSEIIYPPVDVDFYAKPQKSAVLKDFFLYVGRLVAYKRAQILVETFNDLKLPLAIVGSGMLEKKLRQIANSNIHFFNQASSQDLASFYQSAKALIFFHEEDFGIIPVEAMAAGIPVIGLDRGGVTETVTSSTGILIEDDIEQLKSTILNFDSDKFDATVLKLQAQNFSKDRFKKDFVNEIDKQWRHFKNISIH